MMFASSKEKLAIEVAERTRQMAGESKTLCKKILKNTRKDLMKFQSCTMPVGWSRSPSTLADKTVKVGHANEIDKWERYSTSTEADPLKLFDDRGKDFQSSRKFIYESTPAVKGRSRIERLRLQGTNCRYHVPCPHCQKYQLLVMEQVKWKKSKAGKSDPKTAKQTAYYECEHCSGKIKDHHRGPMMRKGVWAPENSSVSAREAMNEHARRIFSRDEDRGEEKVWSGWSKAKWIKDGVPPRIEHASYQLSSLYALAVSWGDVAYEFLTSLDSIENLKNFRNQWLAETWEFTTRKQTWEQFGEKISRSGIPRGIVPNDASLITIGVDKQGHTHPWVAVAWRPGMSPHVVDYGEIDEIQDLAEEVKRDWVYEDGGTAQSVLTLIDAGYRPTEVHEIAAELTKSGFKTKPCRGSTNPLNTFYRERTISQKGSKNVGKKLVWVDPAYTEDWLDRRINTLKTGDIGYLSLCEQSLEIHQDFLEQMLNGVLQDTVNSKGKSIQLWVKAEESVPNDYRDSFRYALVATLMHLRGKEVPKRKIATNRVRKAEKQRTGGYVERDTTKPYVGTID
jgi:phage terminase large subunit GpA-like protein